MRTARTPAEAAQVTFVAALAAAEVLDGYAGRERVSIKWPNDVMLDGVKVAGILVESGAHADGGLDGLLARADFQLAIQVLQVRPYGLGREHEQPGDVVGRRAA